MNQRLPFLPAAALTIALLASGCVAPADDAVGSAADPISFGGFPISVPGPIVIAWPRPAPPTIEVPSSCNRNRMVGVPQYTNRCPRASGSWQGRQALGGVRTAFGAPICRYDYVGDRGSWSIAGLPKDIGDDDVLWRPAHEWLTPDCDAVVPLGDPSAEATLEAVTAAHQDAWREHIGRVGRLPAIASAGTAPDLPVPVRVAVLDDVRRSYWWESDFPVTGTSHGQSVALAIRDILCPAGRDGVCPVEFESYSVIDEGASGGGSILALAEAIVRAARDGADVINLSVGFDERFAWRGDVETKLYFARAEAIRAALQYAACQGAVVIAAAGNDGLGPEDRSVGIRPMYPAAFARERRYSCGRSPSELREPLLHLASGLGPADEDLANSRPYAIAELAAPAFAITFDDPRANAPAERLPLRTGSSFGAAGVSAIAALVRAYRPNATIAETMDIVHQSAVHLSRHSDVCTAPRSGPCFVRRVSACAALEATLDELCREASYFWSCPVVRASFRCDTPAAGAPVGPSAPDFDPTAVATLVPSQYRSANAPGCESSTVQANGSQSHYCPDEAFENGINDPGTLSGQPGDDPCRVCGVTLGSSDPEDWMVVIGLDPRLTDSLSSPTLRVGDESYALGDQAVSTASTGQVVGVRLPPLRYTPSSATLSFRNGSGNALSSQLPVW